MPVTVCTPGIKCTEVFMANMSQMDTVRLAQLHTALVLAPNDFTTHSLAPVLTYCANSAKMETIKLTKKFLKPAQWDIYSHYTVYVRGFF